MRANKAHRLVLPVLAAMAAAGCSASPQTSNPREESTSGEQAPSAVAQRTSPPEPFAFARLALPHGIHPSELAHPSAAVRARLEAALLERSSESAPPSSDVVVWVGPDGRPVLPDAERARDEANLDGHPALPLIANELTFTFDSPSNPWTADELALVHGWLDGCYPVVKAIYGSPAFSNTVNLRKGDTNVFAGFYSPSTNEITISPFRVEGPVVCHELVHAFHDDFLLGLASWEEGFARAVEVEATKRAGIPNFLDHSHEYDVHYQELNQPVIGARDGNIFAGWSQTLMRYQLGGYAFAKAMIEEGGFFAAFNASLYGQAAVDPAVTANEAALVGFAAAAKPSVENLPFSTWYAGQRALATTPPVGDFVYVRAGDIQNVIVSVFSRDASGTESNHVGSNVQWNVTNDVGTVVASGSDTTNVAGVVSVSFPIPAGYTGRLKITATATPGAAPVVSSAYSKASIAPTGVFGIVTGATAGSITLTPLDSDVGPVTVAVSEGAFEAESLRSVKGRIRYVFTSSGASTEAAVLTKDDAPYFVHIDFKGGGDAGADGGGGARDAGADGGGDARDAGADVDAGGLCGGLRDWFEGTTDSTVQHFGNKYTCLVPGWCRQRGISAVLAWEPGVGSAWPRAWRRGGSCGVGCFPAREWFEGITDPVVVHKGHRYACIVSGWCRQPGISAVLAWEPGVGSAWRQAWRLAEPCLR